VWSEQFNKAIADRIRGKVNDCIDAIISERLKTLTKK
jgi:hypothetical protein